MPKFTSLIFGVIVLGILLYLLFGRSNMSTDNKNTAKIAPNTVQASYTDYTTEADFADIEEEQIVLFFHADWCSTCNVIDKDIIKQGVPEGLHIVKVDFDEEEELKKKYNVLTQSSFAQIDKDGTLIKRRVGGWGVDDIVTKLEDTELKPREKVRQEQAEQEENKEENIEEKEEPNEEENDQGDDAEIPTPKNNEELAEEDAVVPMVDTSNTTGAQDAKEAAPEQKAEVATTKKAYFAGGCFWCMEGPFESMDGVESAVSGYAGGTADTANYKAVGSGKTQHREAVEVTYDPARVDFGELVQTYRYQIDPTDDGGQFGDRGYQYTTTIYYQNNTERSIAQESKDTIRNSQKFDEPIAVAIEPFTTFFAAEEEHQDYYLKQSAHYNRYKKGSGRAGYIEDNREADEAAPLPAEIDIQAEPTPPTPDLEDPIKPVSKKFEGGIGEDGLDEMQRKVVFEQGTEPPFDNKYRDHKEAGIYVDILDGTPLFSSTDKFDSGTGRPSFTTPIDELLIGLKEDTKYGMVRTEVETANDTHLGHVFNDGPDGGQRYCINSAALDFVALEDMEKMGYGEYMVLFQ